MKNLKFKMIVTLAVLIVGVAFAAFRSITSGDRVYQTYDPVNLVMGATSDTTDLVDGDDWATTKHIINVGEVPDGITLSETVYIDLFLLAGDESDGSDLAAVTSSEDYYGTLETAGTGLIKRINAASEDDAAYEIEYRNSRHCQYSAVRIVYSAGFAEAIAYTEVLFPDFFGADDDTVLIAMVGDTMTFFMNIGEARNAADLAAGTKIEFFLVEGDSVDDTDPDLVVTTAGYSGTMEDAATGLIKKIDDSAEDDTLYTISYIGTADFCGIKYTFTGTHTTAKNINQLVDPYAFATDQDSVNSYFIAVTDSAEFIINVGICADAANLGGDTLYIDLRLVESVADTSTDTEVDANFVGALEDTASGLIKRIDAATDDVQIYTVKYYGDSTYAGIRITGIGKHSDGTTPISITGINTAIAGVPFGFVSYSITNGGIPISVTGVTHHAERAQAPGY